MEFVTDPDDQGSAMEVDNVDTPEIFGEGVIVPLTFKINAWNSTFLSCLEFDIISNCCQIFFVVIILRPCLLQRRILIAVTLAMHSTS
ncbi:hypothetical protein ES332_D10G138000v1 [Gossypium tomentosum]|uniref:Uncharacterized protein n=1 Tax=Gossypium tomentosum TaxID=34277 RepID=A0A5D2J5B7_GOSTO|nr:hypothetical protein ES332_D10G138000v1 [Gossypium tomentosum]